MSRLPLWAAVVGVYGLTGCASTWDKVTSRDFKEQPFQTMFGKKPDPLHVLRTSPEGFARAEAMQRLEEPLRAGGSQADQDEVIDHILGPAAGNDPSPVVRAAAIDALARFEDPRALNYLMTAYHQADGQSRETATRPEIQLTSGRTPLANSAFADGLGLHGPSGFPGEVSTTLRAKAVAGVAKKERPEAVQFLAAVAAGSGTTPGLTGPDRDTRMAAVRALGNIKSKESVAALAAVLNAEHTKDVAIAGRAHEGLIELTGQDLPADPVEWNRVVQAGFVPKANSSIFQTTSGSR